MEAEPEHTQDLQENELIQLIVQSYKGRTQEEVKHASDVMMRSLDNPVMIDKLITIMSTPSQPRPNLKKSIALLIKKYSFLYAHIPGDKSQFIEKVYQLIMKNDLQFPAKEVLGLGLESVLHADKQGRYKRVVMQKTLSIFDSSQGLQKMESCLIIFQVFFNTLAETEQQIQLFFDIIQPLNSNSMALFRQISGMSLQVFRTCDKPIMIKMSKLFCFLEHMLQGIFEQADEYPEYMTEIRENPFLIEVIQNYLVLFHNGNSIISQQYNQINQIKRVIMDIVVIMYKLAVCPLNIFKLAYATFLSEAKTVVNDFEVQSILVLCAELMDDHLERKCYQQLFAQNKLDTLFALFIYSVTNLEEYQYIEENPQKFVQIAEDYTQANIRKDYLKIKAGALLQLFIQKIDEALRNVVDIVIMISAQILQPENKTAVPQIGQRFGKYPFYNLSDQLKLQTNFMILANLSRFISKRFELNKLVNSFLSSHFNNILQIKSHLPVLRLIRLISYYPTAIYFVYIESNLTQGKPFILEGIKSFERILKTNRYPQLLGLLSSIFVRLMGVIRVSDPIMQTIVIDHHGTMLKKQPQLYNLCLQKIRQQFFRHKETNQHATLMCFNLISALLEKEKEEEHRKQIIKLFYQIDDFLLQSQKAWLFDKYQEKLIEIIDVVITIRNFSAPEIEHFVQRTMRHISRYQKGSAVFKMYNNYITKMEGAVFKLQKYFQVFWEEVKHKVQLFYENEASLETVPYYCLLMSQIIGNNTLINLSDGDLDQILTIVGRLSDEFKQYPLLVFLSYTHQSPYKVVKYLKNKNVYQNFLEEVTNVRFEGQLPKKILILALIRLVEIQEQVNTFKIIIEYCIKYLKLQYQKSRKILMKVPTYEVRPRRLGEERLIPNEDLDCQENDNELVNIFVNFKHPYQNISEYDNFKVIHSHRHGLLKELSPEITGEINSILSTEWVDNKTRRILHVK